ncbi:hypothetical protein K2173_018623 [Erythroxylum novogranatense]|uniref:RIN4 pathogenic type III effector avirulence factor Avr cleavage site domain-containing protein n=1 Tax=Erythroxylum novogranatense TaxID=1862640 RepID=A0AAV8SAI2_9ROSI|nr:hypothetical protein K2173_018623 [Erythroxylum novogranatense]
MRCKSLTKQRSQVPKFGNWESEENVPYTAYFDKARKGRTQGKMINPNDPEETPDLVYPMARAELEGPERQGAARQIQEFGRSRDESEPKQFVESPVRPDNMNRKESATQRYGGRGETNRRAPRQNAGSEHIIERSPLHAHARISGKSNTASPVWEGKGHDSSHGTPGRSRLRPRGDESPDRGAAVPRFGEWDENPTSAEGYTHIFNRVREEKQAGMVPGVPNESPHGNIRRPSPSKSSKSCCFPWCRN